MEYWFLVINNINMNLIIVCYYIIILKFLSLREVIIILIILFGKLILLG